MKIRFHWPAVFVLLTVLVFLVIKFASLTYRFGDGNAYFYMAKHLWSGLWPYRDYFLADPPGQILLLAPLAGMVGHKYIILQALPILFESISAVLIYLILKRHDVKLAYLAPFIYLSAFMIISTSDYATGAQLMMMLALAGIYFAISDKPIISGIGWALAILVKLYALPLALAFLCYLIYEKKYRDISKIVISGLITGAILLLPFIFMAPKAMLRDIFIHQFHRTSGVEKIDVFGFFLTQEWFWLILMIFGIIVSKQRWPLFMVILSVAFLLIFKDIYFLYFLIVWPWVIMLVVMFFGWMYLELEGKNIYIFWATALSGGIFIIYSWLGYYSGYANAGRFTNAWEVAEAVKALPQSSQLYGSHEIVPLVALLSDREIFGNYIDTNTQTFASGAQDMTAISTQAVKEGVYLMARVVDYPNQGYYNIGIEKYIDPNLFINTCEEAIDKPSTANESDNKIKGFYCKERT